MGEGRGESWADAIRARRSKDYWRSLADLLDQPPRPGEFPPGADEKPDGVSRREFLGLLGASMALAGAAGCSPKPAQKILPYTDQPPEVQPGTPLSYATAMVLDGVAMGLLVEAREGRPIKVDGNPEHPSSLGGTGVKEQASLLGLYDPERGQSLRQGNVPRSWRGFRQTFAPAAGTTGSQERLAVLMEPTSSPLIVEMMGEIQRRYPRARFFFHAPVMGDGAVRASQALFGRPLATQLDLEAADVVVALDSDLLAHGPFAVHHAKHFGRRRDPAKGEMNRLYVAEPSWTPTGTLADHRLAVGGRNVRDLARALAAELAGDRLVPSAGRLDGWRRGAPNPKWVKAVADDLRAHRGRGLVVAGERQPPEVHALVALVNEALGNVGRTVRYTEHPVHGVGEGGFDLEPLARALDAGEVDTLLVLGGNPVFTAPEHGLKERIPKARRQVYVGEYENETAEACEWYVPAVHYLEAWGDARAWDGTLTPIQPLIRPLHNGRTESEVLAVFLGAADVGARELLRRSWERRGLGGVFEAALQRGFVEGTAFPASSPTADAAALEGLVEDAPAPGEGLEVELAADPKLHDGRFANNAWLLELPHSVTTLSWENAALVSPLTAERLRVDTGRLLEIEAGDAKLQIPAQVVPGQADGVITLHLGWGRESGAEKVAKGRGVNAFPLRTRSDRWFVSGAKATRREGKRALAITQEHWSMEGRPIAPTLTQSELRAHPEALHALQERQPTLRQEWPAEGVQWGMAIDLNLCTGCNACVVACQSENNVPVVGKVNVRKGREMHWLRLDRYFTGSAEKPNMVMQPMMCQHCERAPCEYVCPVNATTHSPDGINEMTYNRCVGTRFCSNNCPYKVRRFNWFDFHSEKSDLEQLVFNPDVTVRDRGVMEKCTYCVQRVRRAQNRSRVPGETFEPTEVQSACQQACPTDAIVFGPVSDPASEVSRKHEDPRAYKVLNEYGTEPRTRYLARVTNPNPELQES